MDASEHENSVGTGLFDESFKEVLPAMMALPAGDIIEVNLSIPAAVTVALGVQPALLELKARILPMLEETERHLPEKLGVLALALSHAHTLYMVAVRDNDPVPSLSNEGMKLRSFLSSSARLLAKAGLVEGQGLHFYKGSTSYEDLAFDLQGLAQLFRSYPESVRRYSAAGPAELQRAEKLASDLLHALRRRKKPDPAVEAACDVRNRAFTVFTRGYGQLRDVVRVLRRKERDIDRLIPSLYTKRHRSKKKNDTTRTPEPDFPERRTQVAGT